MVISPLCVSSDFNSATYLEKAEAISKDRSGLKLEDDFAFRKFTATVSSFQDGQQGSCEPHLNAQTLSQALCKLPNLDAIVVDEVHDVESTDLLAELRVELRDCMPVDYEEVLPAIFEALAESNSALRSFRAGKWRPVAGDHSLPVHEDSSLKDFTRLLSRTHGRSFDFLRELTIGDLLLFDGNDRNELLASRVFDSIRPHLCRYSNLTTLCIDGNSQQVPTPPPMSFDQIFADISLQHLQCLKMYWLTAHSQSFVAFIGRHASTLARVVISCCKNQNDVNWSLVLDNLRTNASFPRLEDFVFYGCFWERTVHACDYIKFLTDENPALAAERQEAQEAIVYHLIRFIGD